MKALLLLALAAQFEIVTTFKTHDAYDHARTCLRSHSIPFNDYPKGPDGDPGVGVLNTDLERAASCLYPEETTNDA